jgi:hypothetical protein
MVVFVAVCGCGSKGSRDDGAVRAMDEARAHERGTAGPRDYRKAAAIYASLCRDGAGNLAACHALLRAIYEARGVAFDRVAAARLGLAMCMRGEPFGCVTAVIFRDHITISAEQLAAAGKRSDAADEECRAGAPAACEAALLVHGIGAANTAASQAERGRALGLAACQIGVLDGCDLVVTQDQYASDGAQGDGHQHAVDTLTAACDAGDATACEVLPGRRVDPALLCAAHAYQACADLGCGGDESAARLARDHGVTPSCEDP